MALGSWGKTHTPENDPDAPPAVGNDGELNLESGGESRRLLVQSASFGEGTLTVRGESVDGSPQFVLCFALPEGESDAGSLRGAELHLATGGVASHIDRARVGGGVLQVSRSTGDGPWEIDGSLELSTSDGSYTGSLEARVR